MFNAYAKGGNASASANNYLKINAITGTLVKNHPMSIFVTAAQNSNLFDPTNPRFTFPKAVLGKELKKTHEVWNGCHWQSDYCEVDVMKDIEVPCVVLQAMIIADGLFLCEIVKTEDFLHINESEGNENA